MLPGNVVAPVYEILLKEIRLNRFRLPLMKFAKGQLMAIRHIEPLVLVVREVPRMSMNFLAINRHLAIPSKRIDTPTTQIRMD